MEILQPVPNFNFKENANNKIFSAFMPAPNAPTTLITTDILLPGRRSLVSNASCLYFVNFPVLFVPRLLLWACHVTDPNLLVSTKFQNQVCSFSISGFS